mmetsp:Transcript_9554/g.9156  ORF Transcript_9554/g.9156 Transcript_9554/m.9156 type:complete len:188 (-) Transcript_9554:1557-2120(-)
MRGIDNTQSFGVIDMTNNFENVRHFFSNVYHQLCSKLIPMEGLNPLLQLQNERVPQLHTFIGQILVSVSHSFQHCNYLKDSSYGRNRDGARRGHNHDPASVEMLQNMGFQRDRIISVLNQTSNVEHAAIMLSDQLAGIEQEFENMYGAHSSDESDDAVMNQGELVNLGQFQLKQKFEKVTEENYQKT